jgi:hypothetical protein
MKLYCQAKCCINEAKYECDACSGTFCDEHVIGAELSKDPAYSFRFIAFDEGMYDICEHCMKEKKP